MNNFRRLLLSQVDTEIQPIAIKSINKNAKIQISYPLKYFRLKAKFSFNGYSGGYNDSIASIGGGGFGFGYNPSNWRNRVKPIYWSISTLSQHATPSQFEVVQLDKIYEMELQFVDNTITGIIDGITKYSYAESNYVYRDLYLFTNIANEGAIGMIYYCKVYSDMSEDSLYYDLVPYEDKTNNIVGFKNLISGNIYSGNNLVAFYE